MDATADYPSSPYLSDVDASESAPSTPEPNLSDPRSPRLSDAANFSNSSDVVCISSGESDEPPSPKKKLTASSSPPKRGHQHSQTLSVNMTLSLEEHRSKRQLLMRSSRWITLQVADELFPDCRRSGVFVNVNSNCCPYVELKTRYFVSRNAPNETLQGFAVRSNVSS